MYTAPLDKIINLYKSNKFVWIDSEVSDFISGDGSKNAFNFLRELKNRYDDLPPVRGLLSSRLFSTYLSAFTDMLVNSTNFTMRPECESAVLQKLGVAAANELKSNRDSNPSIKILLCYIICIVYVNRLDYELGGEDGYDYTRELYKSGLVKFFEPLIAILDADAFETELRSSVHTQPLSLKSLSYLPEYYSEMLVAKPNPIPEVALEFERDKYEAFTTIHKSLKMDSYKGDLPIRFSSNAYGESGLIKKLTDMGFGSPKTLYTAVFGNQNPDVNFHLTKLNITADKESVTCEFEVYNHSGKEVGQMSRTFAFDNSYLNLDYFIINPKFQTKGIYKRILTHQLATLSSFGFREITVSVHGGAASVAFATLGFDFIDRDEVISTIVSDLMSKKTSLNIQDAELKDAVSKIQQVSSAKELSRLKMPNSKVPELKNLGVYALVDTTWDARLSK